MSPSPTPHSAAMMSAHLTKLNEYIQRHLARLRDQASQDLSFRPAFFTWELTGPTAPRVNVHFPTLITESGDPYGAPSLILWDLGHVVALYRALKAGCVQAKPLESDEDLNTRNNSDAAHETPGSQRRPRTYDILRDRLIETIKFAIGRPLVQKGSKAIDPRRSDPSPPNLYRWQFSQQYPNFPETKGGISRWSAEQIWLCHQALDEADLVVVNLAPGVPNRDLPLQETSVEDINSAARNDVNASLDDAEVSTRNAAPLSQGTYAEGADSAAPNDIETDLNDNTMGNTTPISDEGARNRVWVCTRSGQASTDGSYESIPEVPDQQHQDLRSFKQEIDAIAEHTPHSRDMTKDFHSLQTRMLEAIVGRKCEELRRSLTTRHAYEKSKLKAELDETSTALKMESDTRKFMEDGLKRVKSQLLIQQDKQRIVEAELDEAKTMLDMQRSHSAELHDVKNQLQMHNTWNEGAMVKMATMDMELNVLREKVQLSDARASDKCLLAKQEGEIIGRNKAIEDLDASMREERLALRRTHLDQIKKAREGGYRSGFEAGQRGLSASDNASTSQTQASEASKAVAGAESALTAANNDSSKEILNEHCRRSPIAPKRNAPSQMDLSNVSQTPNDRIAGSCQGGQAKPQIQSLLLRSTSENPKIASSELGTCRGSRPTSVRSEPSVTSAIPDSGPTSEAHTNRTKSVDTTSQNPPSKAPLQPSHKRRRGGDPAGPSSKHRTQAGRRPYPEPAANSPSTSGHRQKISIEVPPRELTIFVENQIKNDGESTESENLYDASPPPRLRGRSRKSMG